MPEMTNGKENTGKKPDSPMTLVEQNKLFRIPLYQRPYAWETEQVEQLLKDLLAAFTKAPNEDYHLGLLSVAESVDARLDLIDGQQRMTTLMLIGKAAKESYSEWEGFLNGERLKLYGRQDDQAFLKSGISSTDRKGNPKMEKALASAKDFFSKKLDKVKPEDFSKFIFERATFFLAETPPKYSPKEMNQHFVRMNNRGKQLENHEILKTRLFGKLKGGPKYDQFLNTWNEMVACMTGSAVAAGGEEDSLEQILFGQPTKENGENSEKYALYSAILNIQEFLLIALSRTASVTNEKNERFFEKDRLLETFDNKLGDEVSKIEEFMEVLEKQLDYLKKFFIFIAKSGERYELGEREEDKSSEVFDFGSDAERTKKHLVTLQSYLYVSTLPYHWLGLAFDYCEQQARQKIDAQKFIVELERIDNLLISNETRQISELKLPEMRYNNISHYWFYRLDYELWKLAQEKDNAGKWAVGNVWQKLSDKDARKKLTDFRFRRSNSVEHINPQTPPGGGTWPNPVVGHIDSFGNLALISSSDNSKFSNYPADIKRNFVMNAERVHSLKMLHFLWCVDDFDAIRDPGKTAKAIDEVGKEMFEILCTATNTAGCNGENADSTVSIKPLHSEIAP